MISITRLLELKKDLARARELDAMHISGGGPILDEVVDIEERLGDYQDILRDYLRIQQGSA